jgi:hypothetical protein
MVLDEDVYSATINLSEGVNSLTIIVLDNWDNQTEITGTINRDSIAPELTIT